MLAAVAAFCATAPAPSTAGGGGDPQVLCWNKGWPPPVSNEDPVYRTEPERCNFFKWNKYANAWLVDAKSLEWKLWGPARARGRGTSFVGMGGGYTPVRIRLKRPVTRCGHQVYSRGKFRFPEYHATANWPLYTC